MKRIFLTVVGTLAVIGLGGLLAAASGLIPIKASSGHWAITAWFLKFSMSRSVSTHSIGIEVPPLDDESLIIKGAAHYDSGCRPCHGSPHLHHPRVAAALTPHPPYLPETIRNWNAEELFYIVKHGVKFTGMPAWPSQKREDEVWAVVAFLLQFPELDANGYDLLVTGKENAGVDTPPLDDLAESQSLAARIGESCSHCHGHRGRARPGSPHLTGQRTAYLTASLDAYAEGTRYSGIMEPIAAGLSSEQRAELARYYAQQSGEQAPPGKAEQTTSASELLELGQSIAMVGVADQKIPACADCHGPGSEPKNEVYPRLAGQRLEYLMLQLRLFKAGHRGGSSYAELMDPVSRNINDRQIEAVATYYNSLTLE